MISFRTVAAIALALGTATPVIAASTDVAYAGPSGWSHVDVPAPTDPNHAFAQWHIAGDVSTVTFIKDGTTSYADALATIHKNFSDNKIKPTVDKDVPCRGVTAHVIEFATGPDAKKIVINRMIVPVGAGISSITYARADGSTFDGDVQKSETAFCSGS